MATGTYNGSMAPMNTSYQLKDGGNQGAVGNQDYPMENNYENEGYENYGDEAGYDGNGEYEAGAEYTGEDAGQYPEGGAYGEDGQYISGEYPPEGVRGEVPPEQMYDRGYTQGAGDGYAPGHPEQGSYYGQEGEPGYNMEDQNYGDENYDSGNYAPDGEQYDEYGENFGAEGDGAQGEGDEYEEESDEESDDEDEDDDEAEDSGGDDEDFSETLNSFEELEPTAEGSSNQSFPYEDEMKNASTSGMDAKEPTAESTPSENPPEGQKRKRKRRKKDETTGEKKEKPKRKRKKKGEKSEDGDKKKADKGARRNIRKILSENKLEQETIDAQQAELERQRRLMEIKKNLQAQQMGMVPVIPEKEVKKEKDSQLKSLLQAAEEDAEKQNDEDEKREEIKKEIKPKKEPGVIDISSAEEEEDDVVMVQSEEEDDLSDEDYAEAEDMNNSGGHINDQFNIRDDQGRVLVNLSHPTSDPDIYLSNNIAMCIKPHQIGGIRFLYDNLVECINRFKTSSGFGCILAHSMGLGKTIQMIGFIDIFLRHTGARTVMVIVPINTLANWMAEFNMWVPDKQTCEQNNMTEEDVSPRPYKTYLLNDNFKNTPARAKVIQDWYETGGVLLLGYEMYRLLSSKKVHLQKSKGRRKASGANVIDVEEEDRDKKLLHGVHEALVNPGPDLVVCDEGHRIKNSHAGISQSLKQIKTKRRIVLTGYPLQNNLIEYWCMVDFVRPNFLGNKTEFCNMFERPIMNGQCADSTPQDVRLMRYRAHVLHSLLEGFVQRRGHTVLQAALPPKQEYVFMIRMSPIQKLLYNKFMESISESGQNGWVNNNPLKAFSVCCKIWNHPDILHTCMKKRLDDNDLDIETGESKKKGGRSRGKKETPPAVPAGPSEGGAPPLPPGVPGQGPTLYLGKQSEPSITYDWANELMKDYMSGLLENGGKMMILFNLIQGSLAAGDKLLVFSQSLFTLNMVEEMLSKRKVPRDDLDEYWCKNRTYFRLDGSTPSTEREKLINQFNNDDTKWLFLLSTRAGSLGINLVGANRVVVLDASWNPCHDCQAICRVYRFGQLKPSFIYRLVTENTMERKIYDRQVNKQGMSDRVVDELNPQSQFRKEQVDKLMTYEDKDFPMVDFSQCEDTYTDVTLIDVLKRQGHWLVSKPFTHESLLIDRKELKLTMKEKRLAKQSYVMEKRLNVSYSRPSYAAYYPKGGQPPYDGMMRGRGINRPIASVKPMVSTPVPMKPKIVAAPQILKPGVSVHQVLTTTEIVLPGTNTSTEAGVSAPKKIPAGQQVLVIRTPKGVYIRTPDGKIFAVRSKPQPDSTSPLDTLANTGSNVGGVTVVRPTTTSSSSSVSKLPSGVTVIRPNTPGTSTTKPLTIIRQGPGPIRTIIPVSLGSKSPSAATTTVSSITSQMLSSASSQLQKGNATAGSNTTTMRVATPNTDGKPGVHSLTALKNLSEGKKIISNSPAFSGGSVVTKTMPKPMATVQTVKPEGLPVLSSSASDGKNESKFLGLEMAEPNEKNSIPEKSDSSWNLPPIDLKALKLPKQFNTTDNADANRLKSNNLNSVSANFKENQSEMLGTSTENSNQSTGSRPKFSLSESPSMSSMSDLSESQSSQSPKAPQMNTPPQRTYQQPGFAGCLSARPSDIDLHELNLASNPNSSQQLSQMISTDSNQLVQRLQSNQSAAFPASTSHRQAKPSQKKPRAKNSNKMHHLQQAQSNIVPKSQSRPIFNPGLPAASGTSGQMSNVGQQVHQMPVQGQNNFMDTFSGAVPGYMGTPADNTIQNTGMGYKAQAPNQNSTSDFMGLSDFGNIQNSSSFLSELNFSETDDNFLSQLGVNSDQGSQNSNEASDLNNPQAMNNFGITSSVGGSANILDTSVGMPSYQNQQQQQSSMNFDNMFSSSHQPQQQQQQQQQQQPQQQQNTGFFPNFNNNHNTYGSNQNMNMSQPGGYPGGSMYPMGGMMQPGMYGYPAFPAYPYPPMMAPMPYYPMPFQPQYGGGRGGNMASPQGGNMGMGQQGQPGTSNSTLGDNNTL